MHYISLCRGLDILHYVLKEPYFLIYVSPFKKINSCEHRNEPLTSIRGENFLII